MRWTIQPPACARAEKGAEGAIWVHWPQFWRSWWKTGRFASVEIYPQELGGSWRCRFSIWNHLEPIWWILMAWNCWILKIWNWPMTLVLRQQAGCSKISKIFPSEPPPLSAVKDSWWWKNIVSRVLFWLLQNLTQHLAQSFLCGNLCPTGLVATPNVIPWVWTNSWILQRKGLFQVPWAIPISTTNFGVKKILLSKWRFPWTYPQSSSISRCFFCHCKPSILGYPHGPANPGNPQLGLCGFPGANWDQVI